MATIHGAIGLTGGGPALDGIRTAAIADNDPCFVQMPGNVCYVYRYESSSTASTETPSVIVPRDNDSGTGAWLKQKPQSSGADYGMGHWQYTTSPGVDPASAATGGQLVPLNKMVRDDITVNKNYPSASHNIYMPAGDYLAWGWCNAYNTGGFVTTLARSGVHMLIGTAAKTSTSWAPTFRSTFFGHFTLSAAESIWMPYYPEFTTGAKLGTAAGLAGLDELHAELIVWEVG